jgi:hypothetical protein
MSVLFGLQYLDADEARKRLTSLVEFQKEHIARRHRLE